MSNQRLASSRLVPVAAALSPDPVRLLPRAIRLDSADTPRDVIDALILAAFADGQQPFSRTARLQEVRPGASLVPAGAQTLRAASDEGQEAVLAAGDGWTVRSILWRSGTAEVTVTAASPEVADSIVSRIVNDAEVQRTADDGLVTIGFWHRHERRGASRSARTIRAQPWRDIRANYASVTAAALDRLMAVTPAAINGQLAAAVRSAGYREDHRPASAGARVAALVRDRLRARSRSALQRSEVPDGGCARR